MNNKSETSRKITKFQRENEHRAILHCFDKRVYIALRINGYWEQLFLRHNSECVSIQLYMRIEADSIAVTCYVVFSVLDDGECLETEYT
jgi:hypothetical protein